MSDVTRVIRVLSRAALRQFAFYFGEPCQFGAELFDHQSNHPHSFVVRMSNFAQHRFKRELLPRQFGFKKLAPAADLVFEHTRSRRPRKRQPCEKWWTLALRRPICAFESVSQRGSTIGCDRVNAAVGTSGRFVGSASPGESQAPQYLDRLTNRKAR